MFIKGVTAHFHFELSLPMFWCGLVQCLVIIGNLDLTLTLKMAIGQTFSMWWWCKITHNVLRFGVHDSLWLQVDEQNDWAWFQTITEYFPTNDNK